MRRMILAVAIGAIQPLAAYAQGHEPPTVRSEQEMKQDAATEKAYLDTLRRERTATQPATNDPWASVRSGSGSGTGTRNNH